MTRAFAVRAAGAALAAGVLAGALMLWGEPEWLAVPWILPLLSAVIVGLLTLSVTSLVRASGIVTGPRALAVLAAAWTALVLGALAQLSWSLGFDLADAGVPAAGLAALLGPLLFGGWGCGTVAIALVVEPTLARAIRSRPARIALALCGGAVIAPFAGLGAVTPVVPAFIAAGIFFIGLQAHPGRRPPVPSAPRFRPPADRAASALALQLAIFGAVVGLFALCYALTGSAWSPAAADSTLAMRQGITIGLAALLPVFGAVGILLRGHHRRSRARQAAVIFAAASCAVGAGSQALAPGSRSPLLAWMVGGAVLGGAALALWIVASSSSHRVAVTGAVFTGALYAVTVGAAASIALGFLSPLIATVVAIVAARRLRPAGERAVAWDSSMPARRPLSGR